MITAQSAGVDMLAALHSGELNSTELVGRIATAGEQARELNALLPLEMDVAFQAAASDARRAAGRAGVLEGLPITIKDNIALAGYPTTGATPALANHDAIEGRAVARLRSAGAIFTAKSNLHELAFGITGENAHTGPVRNPFDRQRLAGGSSSGGAVAVAVGACAVAIGTDTGGSCRIPAAHCGVVGFRPSLYRYPVDGYLELSPSRDTLGILARRVADIALVDGVISGETESPGSIDPKDVRLGVVRVRPIDPEVADAFEHSWGLLRDAGVTLKEVDLSDAIAADQACGLIVALYETARSLSRLARDARGMTLAQFAETIASADVRGLIESQCGTEAIPHEVYADAICIHLPRLRSAFAAALEGCDALAYPTVPITALPLEHGEMVSVGGTSMPVFPAHSLMTRPDSMAGVPAVSLPGGLAGKLPTGFQLTGRAGHDRRLLAIAEAIEAILPPRPVPPARPKERGIG